MDNKQKRSARVLILSLIIIFAVLLAVKLTPVRNLWKKSITTDAGFASQDKNQNTAPNVISFNFEADPKSGDQKGLYKGIAHSGNFSAKVFGKNTYSIAIERKAGEIGMDNMKAVALSAWVYIFPGKNDIESSLVFSASNNGLNLTWQGVTLHGNDMPREKWFKISGFFNLSEITFNPDTKLQIYFWNNSSNDILVDDFYVVFGGPSQRRGDSARVDMTRETSFVPKFNTPPYPFHYFMKDEIGNENSSSLVKNGNLMEGAIQPSDKVIAGHFISGMQGLEDVLVIQKTGKTELFTYKNDPGKFEKVSTTFPADVTAALKSTTVLKGTFSARNNDQLMVFGDECAWICTPEKNKDGSQVTWKTTRIAMPGTSASKGNSCYAADLDGNKFSELLAVHADGSWNIFSFSGKVSHPSEIESGKSGAVAEWNSGKMEMKINTGKFLQKYPQDLLLTIFREKGNPRNAYTIYRYDPGSRSFKSCYPARQNATGKTIGSDTLKLTDEFFAGNFDNSGVQKIFRYNRDWRYDLKEIRFNDSTFQVMANIDFTGYEKDHNPKYFELLRICSGNFLRPGNSTLLLIQKNPGNPGYRQLPDAIQIYSFSKKEN